MDLWDVPAAFAAGLLTGTGIGGGGLFVLYLTAVRSVGQIRAQWLNLILFISACALSVPLHLTKRKTDPGLVALFVLLAVPGTLAGFAVRSVLPSFALRKIFGFMLALTGGYALLKRGKGDGEILRVPTRKP